MKLSSLVFAVAVGIALTRATPHRCSSWDSPRTAWMLSAIWSLPALFVAFYALGFDRWVVTPQDLAEIEERLAQLRLDPDIEAVMDV